MGRSGFGWAFPEVSSSKQNISSCVWSTEKITCAIKNRKEKNIITGRLEEQPRHSHSTGTEGKGVYPNLFLFEQRQGIDKQGHPEALRGYLSSHEGQQELGGLREALLSIQPVELPVLTYTW